MLLVGDIGFRIFDEFRDKYENQFLNCGIAEQNMIGVAFWNGITGQTSYCIYHYPLFGHEGF